MNHEDVKRRLLQNPEVREAYENPPLPLKVARAVVQWRRESGYTQTQLAELLGTSQNQVYRIESGAANTTVATLQKLQERLGLDFRIDQPEPFKVPAHSR